jgi:phage-related tail protein
MGERRLLESISSMFADLSGHFDERMDRFEVTVEEKVGQLKTKVEGLERHVKAIKREFEVSSDRLDRLEVSVNKLAEDFQRQEQKLAQLQQGFDFFCIDFSTVDEIIKHNYEGQEAKQVDLRRSLAKELLEAS